VSAFLDAAEAFAHERRAASASPSVVAAGAPAVSAEDQQ
jgi:hypothetical protein